MFCEFLHSRIKWKRQVKSEDCRPRIQKQRHTYLNFQTFLQFRSSAAIGKKNVSSDYSKPIHTVRLEHLFTSWVTQPDDWRKNYIELLSVEWKEQEFVAPLTLWHLATAGPVRAWAPCVWWELHRVLCAIGILLPRDRLFCPRSSSSQPASQQAASGVHCS